MTFISYAQNAEDVVLCRAFAGHRGGFFVDVGAGDPVRNSVTKNLEDLLGWRGVNLEPTVEEFTKLQAVRGEDVNLNVAVGSTPGRREFFVVRDVPGRRDGIDLSTLSPQRAATHRASGWKVETVEVDVEGAEQDVLSSVDLRRWQPQAVVVEATVPSSRTPSHAGWEPMVLDAGYVLALFDGLNRFYCREGLDDLRAELSIPANVFDQWTPAPRD